MFLGFPASSAGKESACNARDLSLITGLGRSPGEGNDYSLQYSGLENSMDCIVQWVTKSQTRLSDFHSLSPPPPQIFQRRIKRFGVRLHHLFKPIQQMTEEQQLHLGVYASPDRPPGGLCKSPPPCPAPGLYKDSPPWLTAFPQFSPAQLCSPSVSFLKI